MRVAKTLIAEGKKEQAIAVMDTYVKNFPDSKVHFDMYMLPYAEFYYEAGATDKANRLMERLAEISSQNLDYYYSFTGAYRQYFEQDIQTALGILRRMSMVASDYHQTQLAAKMDTLFNMKLKSFQ